MVIHAYEKKKDTESVVVSFRDTHAFTGVKVRLSPPHRPHWRCCTANVSLTSSFLTEFFAVSSSLSLSLSMNMSIRLLYFIQSLLLRVLVHGPEHTTQIYSDRPEGERKRWYSGNYIRSAAPRVQYLSSSRLCLGV